MTWLELKNNIRDLGFDDDTSLTEYQSNIINACNRAINIIQKTVVDKYQAYFKALLSDEMPEIVPITIDTTDDWEIPLPEKVIDLLPLLASYYVWLDDDETKAVYYRNDYEEYRDDIIDDIIRPRKLVFQGGVNFE